MNTEPTIQMINIELIIPNRFQPRFTFDEQGLNELASSIKEHGIIQPIVLRRSGDKYEIIAGERRYKASCLAGMTEVPAIISNLDDNESAEVALVENVQRRNLSSIEEAKSYKKILDKDYLTQEQLAKKMGISQSAVANKLRLLNLVPEVQDALLAEKISERHARSLLQLANPEEQKQMLSRIINERLTVRQLDIEIKNITNSNIVSTDALVETAPVVSDNAVNPYADNLGVTPPPEEIVVTPVVPAPLENLSEALDQQVIEEINIETLDLAPNDINIDEIKKEAADIIAQEPNKLFNIFETQTFPSLEDEEVNMNFEVTPSPSPSFNPFSTAKEENSAKAEADDTSDLETPETEVLVPSVPEVHEEKIKPNNLPAVAEVYQNLEAEIKAAGYDIASEEFDFEDLYQIIIKIKKTSPEE